jgi:peptidoglycan/LPS O-acetylase OafA/YrhL
LGVMVFGRFNPGVFAVISFFLISGYVMTGLIRRHYADGSHTLAFYLDRGARIFPQYLLFMGMTTLLVASGHVASPYVAHPSAAGMAANLLVVPLDFYMLSPDIEHFMLVPQAWSLGLELSFYALAPWALRRGALRAALTVGSLAIWLLASAGAMNTDWWGYRLLPGTLFIFLAGSYLYDDRRLHLRHPAVQLAGVLAVAGVLLALTGRLTRPYTPEVLTGFLFGLPMLWALSEISRTRLDERLGNLSYGVFLSHFLVMWAGDALHLPRNWGFTGMVLAGSVALGWCGFRLIEAPALRWRHRLRRRVDHDAVLVARPDEALGGIFKPGSGPETAAPNQSSAVVHGAGVRR